MKIEHISSDGFKAVLNYEDLRELSATDRPLSEDDAVYTVLSIAKAEFGFRYGRDDCDISIDQFDGGCEIAVKRKTEKSAIKTAVFCYSDRQALVLSCMALRRLGVDGGECRYESFQTGIYYLILSGEGADTVDGEPYTFLTASEMCDCVRYDDEPFLTYIREHSSVIFEKNAVYHIAKNEKEW